MSDTASGAARRRYWKKNLMWLGGLLTVWFLVSYGCGDGRCFARDAATAGGGPGIGRAGALSAGRDRGGGSGGGGALIWDLGFAGDFIC